MANEIAVPLNEIDRHILDQRTVRSVYQAGYSVITVKSIFGTKENFPDLLCRIIQRKLDTASIT